MKILSRMMSKKIDPDMPDLHDMDDEDDVRTPEADDTGQVNPTRRAAPVDLSGPLPTKDEEPEVAGSGWGNSEWDDGDWDDDDDWGEEDLDQEMRRRSEDKKQLVSEIRDAMISVGHMRPASAEVAAPEPEVSEEDELEREAKVRSELQAKARSELVTPNAGNEDRILEKTENVMEEEGTSRRRSAIAHMKAAAAATKADRVLRHVAGHDPSADPEEQSPYRDDLAKVVRPQSASRPISRMASRTATRSPIWDQGQVDEDAALYAAAEEAVAEPEAEEFAAAEIETEFEDDFEDHSFEDADEPAAFAPDALSEDDFADDEDDEGYGARAAVRSAFPSSRFAQTDEEFEETAAEAFGKMDEVDEINFKDDLETEDEPDVEDAFEDEEEDDFAPRPSSAVAEAIAFANATDEELDTTPPEPEVRKKIWEMADEVAAEMGQGAHIDGPNFAEVATVVSGRAGGSAGRVKTRLLGFQAEEAATKDVFQESSAAESISTAGIHFPSGWIVVTDGPGRGASFTLQVGVSQIGRGEEQAVRLDFGDTSISRNNHAAVAYDDEQGKFFLGHGGKSNLVRLNGMPVLSTEELTDGDEIRIGETTLKFIALCGEAFTWTEGGEAEA